MTWRKKPKVEVPTQPVTLAVVWPHLTKVERATLVRHSEHFNVQSPGMLAFVDINHVGAILDYTAWKSRNNKLVRSILRKIAPYRQANSVGFVLALDGKKLHKDYTKRQMKTGIPVPGASPVEVGNNFRVMARPTFTISKLYSSHKELWDIEVSRPYWSNLKKYLQDNYGADQ